MNNKPVISVIIILFIIFSTAGLAFAGGGNESGGGSGTGSGGGNGTNNGTTNETVNGTASALITVAFDKTEAKVGDTVIITVTITNNGTIDLTNIIVSAPLPEGLKYLSAATNTTKSNYTSTDGTWNVGNLKTTSKLNGVKYLYITAEVLPSAENKKLIATAKYINIEPAISDPDFKMPGSATSNILKIQKNTTETGSNNSTGAVNGNNSSSDSFQDKENAISKAINAAKSENGITALQNLNKSSDEEKSDDLNNPSDKGNSYEVSNSTNPDTSSTSSILYTILGILGVSALVGFGYFKGLRK